MTDRTNPDSGHIITSSDILLHDAETALMYEELRAAIDDGHESMTHADALVEIAAIRAENVELRTGYAAARLEIESLQARIKTMAEEHADELMVAHMDGRMRAAQQEAQEPVAWYVTGCSRLLDEDEAKAEARHIGGTARAIPLYTAPQPSPKADSQPAPANTRQIAECYGDCPTDPKTCANQCKFEGRAPHAPADSRPAPVQDVERKAFKAAHRHLELDEVPDAWGRPMFKYSHVEASWLGWIARAARAPADSEVAHLRAALVYTACALHATPQYMLAEGITLIDGDTVRVSRDGWTVEASVNPARATPPAQAADSVLEDAARLEFEMQHGSAIAAARKQGANHG